MRDAMKFTVVMAVALLIGSAVFAQNPTGTLSGKVTDGKDVLPGVTITASSPAMQGTRTAVSGINGDYVMTFLPPGNYKVVFALQGFQTIETEVKLSAAQTTKLNAEMPMAKIAEQITVTGTMDTISHTASAASTLTKQFVDDLPVNRTIAAAIIAAPGTSTSGPGGNVTISGAQSYENLWLVNGVVINENVRQQALPLFIEDAIQETTTQTSGVSAEYGRFAGGVVTMLTKSGGNEFSGSLRLSMNNNKWNSLRPGEATPKSVLNKQWEATLGGFAWKDRIWFFVAGRDIGSTVDSYQTSLTNLPYDRTRKEKRFEGKVTFSLTPEHRIIGSYEKIDASTDNDRYTTSIMDLRSLTNRKDPQKLWSVNYSGVITPNFFVEAQYSKRDYSIGIGAGSTFNDRIFGTLLLDRSRSNRRYWSPTFCAPGTPACPEKLRNNKNWLTKGTYFLTTPSMGSHDVTFGYDHFEEFNLEENHQSGSDYRIYTTGAYIEKDPIVPIFSSKGRKTYFYYQPQLTKSQGSKMQTNSMYVNDKWRLGNNFSFNIGVRYDKNDGTDSGGNTVAKDSRFSPRLAASWDVKGNGDLQINATASRYVTAIVGTGNVGDAASTAGLTSVYLYYGGPEINTDPTKLVSTEQALAQFFAWLDSVGGAFKWAQDSKNWRFSPDYPGLSPVLLGSLDSPYVDEYTIGATKRIGNYGLFRFDYVHRKFASFYLSQTDLTTGTATTPAGLTFDRAIVKNDTSGKLSREYDGFHFSGQYRKDKLTISGNYTLSYAKGNFIGETQTNGPITSGDLSYPEFQEARWNHPSGYLPIDQRHRLRAFLAWDIFANTYNRLNLGVAQYWATGAPYEAVGTVDVTSYVTNPGYKTPTYTFNYYFSRRGAYRRPDIYSTDLSLMYTFSPKLFGHGVEFYVKPEVRNMFNRQVVTGNVDTTVDTYYTDQKNLKAFDPFKETPVEGVNYRKGAKFGQALAVVDYQDPRTYLVAVGIRF